MRIEKLRDKVTKLFISKNNPSKLLIDDDSKKVLFNYPKLTKSNVKLRIDNHNLISPNEIYKLTEVLLKNRKGNTRCIHPWYLMLSWSEVSEYFKIIKCESSDSVEIRPKKEFKDEISWRIQTRETLKIMEMLINNKKFERYFYDYYHYLITLGTKIEVHNYRNSGYQQYTCDLELSFSKKSKIVIEINENHHDKDKDLTRARNFLCDHNSYPILYYPEQEDMTNLMPKIWKEIAFSIAKDNLEDGMKFYLIMVDDLSPVFVDFIIDKKNKENIKVTDIIEFLEIQGMKNPRREVKHMINEDVFGEDEIFYTKKDLLDATVTPFGMDLIFMRLRVSKFKNAILLAKQYHIIKNKYFKIMEDVLSHKENHLKVFEEGYLDVSKKYSEVKNTKHQLPELCSILYQNCKDNIPEDIQEKLHPNYPFLVKEKGTHILKEEWKKISKKDYQKTEEESKKHILNHRFINNNDLKEIKEGLEPIEESTEEDDYIKKKFKVTIKKTNNNLNLS